MLRWMGEAHQETLYEIDIVKNFNQLGYSNHENIHIRGISYSFTPEATANEVTPAPHPTQTRFRSTIHDYFSQAQEKN